MAAVAPGIAHDLVTTCVCLEYLTANPCLRQTSMPTFGRTGRVRVDLLVQTTLGSLAAKLLKTRERQFGTLNTGSRSFVQCPSFAIRSDMGALWGWGDVGGWPAPRSCAYGPLNAES